MDKQRISTNVFPYPMPMALVSAKVDGRVNHLAVAWVVRANANPPMMAVSLGKRHHTNRGIRENRAFGISFPPAELLQAVDYVGIVSGAKVDKSRVFEVFYGDLPDTPMITECPVALACRLVQTVDLPVDELFIGEVVEAYADPACVAGQSLDIEKLRPYLLTMPDNRYWALGEVLGQAWSAGRDYRPPG
jgi:flavin reductase (DIM6/NTAB) family NADH-FMN oxidoreductase RutF